MRLYDSPRDDRLHGLTVDAVLQANAVVKQLESRGKYIGSHFDFPVSVSYGERGYPSFSSAHITDYSGPFGLKRGQFTAVAFDEVSSLTELIDYVLADEHLRGRLGRLEPTIQDKRDFAVVSIALFALNILDRARHIFGDDPTYEQVTDLYLEREPELFLDQLPVEIVIPLVVTKFEVSNRVKVDEHVYLERISDDDQRARVVGSFRYANVNRFVAEAATHALVFTGFTVPAHFDWGMSGPEFFPTDQIDAALAALRLAIEQPTGYAQILLRPIGWSHGWTASLPSLVRALTAHRYPRDFDEQGWTREDPIVPSSVLDVVGHAYNRLLSARSEVQLAARRLNSALLRDREDDALLDACISLEAVLGEHTEIVYRLALRVAALSSLSPIELNLNPREILRGVKRVYKYRSRIIHGSANTKNLAVFKTDDGEDIQTLALILLLLRMVILVLLDHPTFVRSESIEETLLSTALTARGIEEALATEAGDEE